MSSVPDPSSVKPWYLRNITEALALDEASGNVYMRTGITGDVIIAGNVTIPGVVQVDSSHEDPVHTHCDELGNIDLSASFMPISGNVTISSGNVNASVSGTVAISSLPNVNASITGNVIVSSGNIDANVHGNVGILGNVNIGTMPEVEIKNDTGNPIPISATTATNSALNPIYITGAVTTAGGSAQGKLWYFQIAQGLVTGHIPVFKAGYNPSVANNSEESIWAHSNLYPWDSWGAGGTLSCVSTSASDTGTMTIVGLRSSDWTEVTETVTVTGTTPVVTTNSFIRINFLHYNGVNGAANVGEIDVSISGTVVGDIHPGNGIAQMAQYTVPAGYTAYLLRGNANLGKGNDGTGRFKYRPYGSSFQTAMMFLLYQSTFDYEFDAPLPLPEKTDLDVTLTASVSGTAVTCAYSMILIAN